MKIIHKSKKGFTLIEMVIVISIILILAAALVWVVSDYISLGDTAEENVSQQEEEMTSMFSHANTQFDAIGF